MTEIEIVKKLFIALSNSSVITVVSSDGEKTIGHIAKFDGNCVVVDNREILLSEITSIEEPTDDAAENANNESVDTDFSQFKTKKARIKYKNNNNIEEEQGILFDFKDNKLVLVTDANKRIINGESVIEFTELSEPILDKPKEEVDYSYIPNEFETALIEGRKDIVDKYISTPSLLSKLGYSEDEIANVIKSSRSPVPWKDDEEIVLYNQARRIYMYIQNRNHIAEKLFKEFLAVERIPRQLKVKSVTALAEILEQESPSDLVDLYYTYEDIVKANPHLCFTITRALFNTGKYGLVRTIIDDSPSGVDFSDILFSLHFLEKYGTYDFSTLPGLDSLDYRVSNRELGMLLDLPDKNSFLQLLGLYSKFGRYETFFALLDLFMPYARNESRVNVLVSDVLKRDIEGKYLLDYLPQFPLLWLDKELTSRFLVFNSNSEKHDSRVNRLLLQCNHASKYMQANNLEISIMQNNYNSFEVLRSNESILVSFGYSTEEVKRIREFDVDSIKNGEKPAIERLLLVEGNRGYVAVVSAARDFLRDPLAVSKQLFPLLINDNNGALVYELYNYSPTINNKLLPLKLYYLKALLLLGEKEEYWEQIKDNWMSLGLDHDMLIEGSSIAKQNNETNLAELMHLFAEKKALNEFEMAIINGNISKIRALVADPDYLVSAGYSADEIQLIVESIRQRFDFSSADYLSIANRLYAFQKNKNRSAEFYYMLALKNGVELAASGLFAIYASENRHEELCSLYEAYINTSISDTSNNNEQYFIALFKTKQYQKLLALWGEKADLDIDLLMVIIAYVETQSSISTEFSEKIIKRIKVDESNKDLAQEALVSVASMHDPNAQELIIALFNKSFPIADAQEILAIKDELFWITSMNHQAPAGNGIYALYDNYSEEQINEWVDYLFGITIDPEKCFHILLNIHEIYTADKDAIYRVINSHLLPFTKQGIDIPSNLKEYLYPNLKNSDAIVSWMDERICDATYVDESSFDVFCDLSTRINDTTRLHKLYVALSATKLDFPQKYIENACLLLQEYINANDSQSKLIDIIHSIHAQIGRVYATIDELIILYRAYINARYFNWAFTVDYILRTSFQLEDNQIEEINKLREAANSEKSYNLFTALDEEMRLDDLTAIDVMFDAWAKYMRISAKDTATFEEIRDYYNQPSKWSPSSLDALAKHLVSNPSLALYWRLLKIYYSNDESTQIKYCIAFHLSRTEGRMLSPLLLDMTDNGLQVQAIASIVSILRKENTSRIEKYNESFKVIIHKHPEWFISEDVIRSIINALSVNTEPRKDLHVWNMISETLMEMALIGDNEELFYSAYHKELETNLPLLNAKFLCKLLLKKADNTTLLDSTYQSLISATATIPYKEMIVDLMSISKEGQLNEVQTELLLIASENEGLDHSESLYKYYVHSVAFGKEALAKQVFSELEKYYPDLDVIDDVNKYELVANDASDDDILQIYNTEFEKMKDIADPLRAEKVIINMIPGELYLKSKGKEIESAIEYGTQNYSGSTPEQVRRRADLFRMLNNSFDSANYPGLAYLFMKCSFIRNWKEIVEYQLDDPSISGIIATDSSIRSVFYKKTYDVFKSIILCLLDSDSNDTSIIDRSDAIMAATGGINRSKNYLRRIQNMNDDDKAVLRTIFSLRMESKTLRRTGIIGSTILQIPRNEEFAYFVGMLGSKSLEDLFNNKECRDTLLKMPNEKALATSNIYASFFYKGVENVFSGYINGRTDDDTGDDPFAASADRCNETRIQYQKQKNKADQVGQPLPKLLAKNLAQSKMEYLFEAVINHSDSDLDYINPSKIDFLSVLTYLFNRKTTDEMKMYIWNNDTERMIPMLVTVLSFLEQYTPAYELSNRIDSNSWKEAVLQIMFRCMSWSKVLTADEIKIRTIIYKQTYINKDYIMGKFIPIDKAQNEVYVDKMNALRAFCDELITYTSSNGIDVSWIKIDENRHLATLNAYGTYEKDTESRAMTESIINDAQPETVSSIASIDYIVSLLSNASGIKPKECSKLKSADADECIAALKNVFEQKGSSKNNQDILLCRDIVRWTFIKIMDRDGFDRESFNHVLEFISEKDSIPKAQWDSIYAYLFNYFESITDIQQLSRKAENDLSYLKNIGKVSNKEITFLRAEDIKVWNTIISILSIIAGIDYERLPEDDQILKISECRNKLFAITDSSKSKTFSKISDKILRLASDKITKLRHSPELAINIIGENENNEQTILWETGNDNGLLYSIISNVSGTDCQRVSITSTINLSRIQHYHINTLYAGEKVPFTEAFTNADLSNGIVTWNIEVSYYDADKNELKTKLHETKAIIQVGGEKPDYGSMANTGKPAKGKDFVGRNSELTQLRNQFSNLDQLPSLLIRGLRRSGKTSILYRFSDELRKKNRILVAMVDGQTIGRDVHSSIRNAFVRKVLDDIRAKYRKEKEYSEIFENQFDDFCLTWSKKMEESDWIGNLDSFYYELSELFKKKILIFIDEMEGIFYKNLFESIDQEESLYDALRALIQKPDNYVSFIFCGSDALLTSCLEHRRESQMFQMLNNYIDIGQMSFNDIQEIFNMQSENHGVEFTSDAVDAIWQYTHGLVWYAKLLGSIVINKILYEDHTIRKYVNRADIATAVLKLLYGEIGTNKYDLIEANFNTQRDAIVRAMASVMPDQNKEIPVDEIATALESLRIEGYIVPATREPIPNMSEQEIKNQLDFLEKMKIVSSNASRTRYLFTAELYRLFFRDDKKLHLFEEGSFRE